ncbi:hypothetical protein F2P81_020835 [Scophthalmus maximus]|uniref:Uncharacterized protein n=1 Tax=Scophthalmus maximus TaxID=52904 RepID=A0A6A4S1R0_SCOMX|nr:hypothetical protein F2P81_020835 [Scophthalmus maximus]
MTGCVVLFFNKYLYNKQNFSPGFLHFGNPNFLRFSEFGNIDCKSTISAALFGDMIHVSVYIFQIQLAADVNVRVGLVMRNMTLRIWSLPCHAVRSVDAYAKCHSVNRFSLMVCLKSSSSSYDSKVEELCVAFVDGRGLAHETALPLITVPHAVIPRNIFYTYTSFPTVRACAQMGDGHIRSSNATRLSRSLKGKWEAVTRCEKNNAVTEAKAAAAAAAFTDSTQQSDREIDIEAGNNPITVSVSTSVQLVLGHPDASSFAFENTVSPRDWNIQDVLCRRLTLNYTFSLKLSPQPAVPLT